MQVRAGNRVLIEICVESLELAIAAESGGADRIELCSDLACGGVTPAAQLMRAVRRHVRVPIHVLIRPRPGDFCYTSQELEVMRREINTARDIGMDGIVTGVLAPSGEVDLERTRTLVELADPLPVTFHRAFDQVPGIGPALNAARQAGVRRILTSGGPRDAMNNLDRLRELVADAGGSIVIMAGGGIRSHNVARVVEATRANEIHTSLGALQSNSGLPQVRWFETQVREFREALSR